MSQQQGNLVLGMIMMILLLGTAMLNATRQQLTASLSLVVNERQHIINFYAAQAALLWGSKLTWNNQDDWQCQTEQQQQWRACLKNVNSQRRLLRGEQLSAKHHAVVLWHWVKTDPASKEKIAFVPHGWIDFCPLTRTSECQPDVH